MKITRGKKIFLIVALLIYYNLSFIKQKGHYDQTEMGGNLAQRQHNHNDDPEKFTYIYAKANFQIDNLYYYVFKDTVYSQDREKIIDLKPNSEGFIVY